MKHRLAPICATFALLFASTAVRADAALDDLARDVDRAESVRAVKTLQSSYAQYAQFGLWADVGDLFASTGAFVFDGLIKPAVTTTGPKAIADFLRTRYGGGYDGTKANGLSSMFIDAPIVNLSADGESAKARWQTIVFHGHGGQARIEGGVFENDYVRERGVWKIATVRYFPQYDGPYDEGWINWGGGDVPVAPHHADTRTVGIPIPPPSGAAPAAKASLAALQTRVDTMNDEDRVRNLQSAYGYYADRKMWDDVVDLFAQDGLVEVGGQGVWRGPAGVRRWLDAQGKAGLSHGQLNDRGQNDVIDHDRARRQRGLRARARVRDAGRSRPGEGLVGSRRVPHALREGARRVEDPRAAPFPADEERRLPGMGPQSHRRCRTRGRERARRAGAAR